MTYAAYVSTYLLKFPQVIEVLSCLQFLKLTLWLNAVKYS